MASNIKAPRDVEDLPCDLDSERLVLAGVMIDGEVFRDIRDCLSEDDFALDAHRRIYRHMGAMWEDGTAIDRMTLCTRLMDHGESDAVGGLGYLIDLERDSPRLPHYDAYAQSIREKSIRRQAIIRMAGFVQQMREPGDSAEVLAIAEKTLADLGGELKQRSGFSTPGEIVEAAGGLDKYLDRRRASGVVTPWRELNAIIGGLQAGNLVVLAGHTGTGNNHGAQSSAPCGRERHWRSRLFDGDGRARGKR